MGREDYEKYSQDIRELQNAIKVMNDMILGIKKQCKEYEDSNSYLDNRIHSLITRVKELEQCGGKENLKQES